MDIDFIKPKEYKWVSLHLGVNVDINDHNLFYVHYPNSPVILEFIRRFKRSKTKFDLRMGIRGGGEQARGLRKVWALFVEPIINKL